MAVNQVANPRNRIFGFSPNLSSGRGALNTVYGVLGLALTAGMVLFALGIGFMVVLPQLGSLASRVPVVGSTLAQGSGGGQAFVPGGN